MSVHKTVYALAFSPCALMILEIRSLCACASVFRKFPSCVKYDSLSTLMYTKHLTSGCFYGHKNEKYIMRERVDVGEMLMDRGIEAS
ncbi:MAG: hypothetical protein NDJ65_07590 [Paludibacteraceae bacterium]|nr:hypothetical protein [Paludibacteraceae bacterium]